MGTILDDLEGFYLEHRRCGELYTDVEDQRVWMGCEWGAVLRKGLPCSPTSD